jgi:hypothetical protein
MSVYEICTCKCFWSSTLLCLSDSSALRDLWQIINTMFLFSEIALFLVCNLKKNCIRWDGIAHMLKYYIYWYTANHKITNTFHWEKVNNYWNMKRTDVYYITLFPYLPKYRVASNLRWSQKIRSWRTEKILPSLNKNITVHLPKWYITQLINHCCKFTLSPFRELV